MAPTMAQSPALCPVAVQLMVLFWNHEALGSKLSSPSFKCCSLWQPTSSGLLGEDVRGLSPRRGGTDSLRPEFTYGPPRARRLVGRAGLSSCLLGCHVDPCVMLGKSPPNLPAPRLNPGIHRLPDSPPVLKGCIRGAPVSEFGLLGSVNGSHCLAVGAWQP